jgi:hypothetical protein
MWDRREVDDRLDTRHTLAAAERLQRLPEVGEFDGQEGRRRVRRVGLGGWASVDVEHVVPVLEQISDHRSARLAASAGESDPRHGSRAHR